MFQNRKNYNNTFFYFFLIAPCVAYRRMFSQSSRLEYQFFFRTRGAFRRPRLSRLVLIVCSAEILVLAMAKLASSLERRVGPVNVTPFAILGVEMLLFVLAKLALPVILNLLCDPHSRAMSLWSPMAAVLLLIPCLFLETSIPKSHQDRLHAAKRVFVSLLAAVVLVTTSRLRFQCITSVVDGPVCQKMLFLPILRPTILFLCMCTVIGMLGYLYWGSAFVGLVVFFLVFALVVESFGNLQIPAAVARIVIALIQPTTSFCVDHVQSVVAQLMTEATDAYVHLNITKKCTRKHTYPEGTSDDAQKNFIYSLSIFYLIVLVQGVLYIGACVLEMFSFIPRRLLLHRSRFRRRWGMKCVDMYYSYVFEQCSSGGVLAPAPTIMELTGFAMDLTSSDSPSNQLNGVRMLHSFLKGENDSKALQLLRRSSSTATLGTLVSMLGWTSSEDAETRLFAAKVVGELAKHLQIVVIPGSMQNISSLLGTDAQLKRRNPLLCTYESQERRQDTVVDAGDDQAQAHTQDDVRLRQNCLMLECWQWMSEWCRIQKEEPFTDQDLLLPVLGMSILDTLACCGPDNCLEISRATNLIPKIVGYSHEQQPKILKSSSLKLLRKLSNTGGETGMTLRHKMSEHPLLLGNLAEILGDTGCSKEQKKLAAEILRNLAIDKNTRREIGRIRAIISRLIYAFLAQHAPSSPCSSDWSLQMTAGQALSMLTMESVDNCSAMLKEPGRALIRELTSMIQDDRCRYVAASLLQNLCLHAQSNLSSSDLTELSHSLRQVRPANPS
ncbi:hypothetical protein GUJ93_ZPchr0013g33850 [Zizania palustris]|uniref:BLE2 protein n=1 Tax=Zizania palustris TaxID=103762 RepID=A0A8J5WWW4_ZIZPA|nr:hypothetical protein GUJ93_ZPchr0013g33850 [Zizania palustris]